MYLPPSHASTTSVYQMPSPGRVEIGQGVRSGDEEMTLPRPLPEKEGSFAVGCTKPELSHASATGSIYFAPTNCFLSRSAFFSARMVSWIFEGTRR